MLLNTDLANSHLVQMLDSAARLPLVVSIRAGVPGMSLSLFGFNLRPLFFLSVGNSISP